MAGFNWTSGSIDRMRTLWLAGQSAAQVAARLGCTRNAVIGRVNRMGLVRTASPLAAARREREKNERDLARMRERAERQAAREEEALRNKLARAAASAAKQRRAAPIVLTGDEAAFVAAAEEAKTGGRAALFNIDQARAPKTFAALQQQDCRWPCGDTLDLDTFRFCAAPARDGSVYCAAHHALAYVPSAPRPDRRGTPARAR